MTSPDAIRLPIQSESQRIGTIADRAFRRELSDDWIDTSSALNDFGYDYWINVRDAGTRRVGPDFFVQLKGTGAPDLVANGEFLSQKLELSTVNYLMARACPALLAVCDLEDPERPVYWVWLDDALAKLTHDWKTQQTVTLRVPRANRLRDSYARIQAEALGWHEERKVDQALAEAAAIAVPDALGDAGGSLGPHEARQRALAVFAKADLVDIGSDGEDATPISPGEQAIRAKLREAKTLIDSYGHVPASKKLAEIEVELASTPVNARTRAVFFNRRGVLFLRELQYHQAVESFTKAVAEAPDDVRYQLNLITAESVATDDSSGAHRPRWLARVDEILGRDPDSEQAIEIKTRLLGADDPHSAEIFLRASSHWRQKPDDARLLLAEILGATEPTRALEELDLLPADGGRSSQALSLRGFLLFRLAMGVTATATVPVRGYGPGNLDLRRIRDAAAAYEQACLELARLNYPRFCEDVFRNAAQVLVVAGRAPTAVRLCDGFLRAHPSSVMVLEGVSVALNVLGEHDTAAEYLAQCVDAEPNEEGPFRNLLMALYAGDRFEELYERTVARLPAPVSPAEEKVCREFLALATAELGRHDEADTHLRALEALDDAAAAPVAATIAALAGRPPEEIRANLRQASNAYPDDPVLAGHFVAALLPITPDTAPEITSLFRERIAPYRQLSPREAAWYGRAQAERGQLEEAEGTFRRALERFPEDASLAFDLAVTLSDLGRVDEAYDVMTAAARGEAPTPAIQQNLALLAASTGRLDRAIELFEQALRKASSAESKRALAAQIYELRRRRGDPGKELMRAAMQFGKRGDHEELQPEVEARFLMMCLLAGAGPMTAEDAELRSWVEQVQVRLTAFCDRHPRHRALRRFRAPEGIEGESLLSYLMTELMAAVYPALLHGFQAEISARGLPYPLCTRARVLPGAGSTTLSYWEYCIASTDRAHRIHCVVDPGRSADEIAGVPLAGRAVIDATALLTLQELGLLDEALACFDGWVIASETREMIESEALGLPSVNPRARALSEWLVTHRSRVIVRRVARGRRAKRDSGDRYEPGPGGILVRREVSYSELLPDGIGASMELAAQLGLPLFSDEGVARQWVKDRYGAEAFGTVAVLAGLRRRGNLSLLNEAALLSRLLELNYRQVPFNALHLHATLQGLVARSSTVDSALMNEDGVLGPLLRHLGDPELNSEQVAQGSAELLVACIRDDGIPVETTDALAFTLMFKNQQRAHGAVLETSLYDSASVAVATVWARTMAAASLFGADLTRGWTLCRQTVERLYAQRASEVEKTAALAAAITVHAFEEASRSPEKLRNQLVMRIVNAIPERDRDWWYKALEAVSSRGGQR